MATTPAPAASALPLHSAWNPYSVLAPSTRRKVSSSPTLRRGRRTSHLNPANSCTQIDPPNTLLATPYGVVLSIPSPVAAERLSSKYLQLDAPEGKLSDRRKAELAKREEEKAKKRTKRLRDAECGMVGRRKRARRGDEVEKPVRCVPFWLGGEGGRGREADDETSRYDAVLPIHQLWLGYMSELLSLPLLVSTPSAAFAPTVNTPPPPPTQSTSALLPTFSSRQFEGVGGATPADLRLNVPALHAKLVKAEFVGSILSGALPGVSKERG